jgi:hypothetical protein
MVALTYLSWAAESARTPGSEVDCRGTSGVPSNAVMTVPVAPADAHPFGGFVGPDPGWQKGPALWDAAMTGDVRSAAAIVQIVQARVRERSEWDLPDH